MGNCNNECTELRYKYKLKFLNQCSHQQFVYKGKEMTVKQVLKVLRDYFVISCPNNPIYCDDDQDFDLNHTITPFPSLTMTSLPSLDIMYAKKPNSAPAQLSFLYTLTGILFLLF